jgi:hypothetical protein
MRFLALLVLVVGCLAVRAGLSRPDPELDYCPEADETTSVSLEPQWWPPGTLRCEVTRDGDVVALRTAFPLRDYYAVALIALAVAVLPLTVLAALALLLAGLAVYFIGWPW